MSAIPAVSAAETHLVLIPSYNTGQALLPTVIGALGHWPVVFVVVDGSTDGSDAKLADLRKSHTGLHVIRRWHNGGKGAAVFDGLRAAAAQKFTHVLIMDADGQHPAQSIPEFMRISKQNRRAMVLGAPQFDASAPRIRVIWRKLSNILTRLETSRAIADSLFGFRVYPLAELLAVMQVPARMQGFDFDPEAIVRLCWRGVPSINCVAPVRYFRIDKGGVSHFRYGRDNFLLARMHARLLAGFILQRLHAIKLLKSMRDCFRSRSGESASGDFRGPEQSVHQYVSTGAQKIAAWRPPESTSGTVSKPSHR